ncbi:MAG: EVE domain-containing protein [Planctomycetes bacterium]|nr:EVE domain-containing protein [Planctomycetota bacterium]
MKYWLLKTEPEEYSIHDLAAAPDQTTAWDGVRNYQARNFLRDGMRVGDRVLIYHSNTEPLAIVGVAKVVRSSYPDASAFDRKSAYFDAKSKAESPTWVNVDLKLDRIFAEPLTLIQLRSEPALAGMELLRRGSRLSVQPVTTEEFRRIQRLAGG